MHIKQVEQVMGGGTPVIYGKYLGHSNQPRTVIDDKDVKQEKGVITHFIEGQTANGMQMTQIKEFHDKYNKEYKSPFVVGKVYLFPLGNFSSERGVSVAFLSRNAAPQELQTA